MRFVKRLALLSLLGGAPGVLWAQAVPPREFALPGHGALQLSFPDSWRAEVHQRPSPQPPTLTFAATEGARFQILCTVVWALRNGAPLTLSSIHAQVTTAAKALQADSVEGRLPLRGLSGGPNRGYYFAATDPHPKPGEYKFLTQGIVHIDDISVAFTILTNDGQDAVVKSALDMLRNAGHESGSI